MTPALIGTRGSGAALYGDGHAARIQYGAKHPVWHEGIEQRLRGEWMAAQERAGQDWEAVTRFMRRGCGHVDRKT
jgi:hypothetical protein